MAAIVGLVRPRRAAEAYVSRPRGSSFARSLVAIAEAGEEDAKP